MKNSAAIIPKGVFLAATLFFTANAFAQSAPSSKAKDAYFAAGCHQCHGVVGQGARGPTLAAVKYPYDAFRLFVRRPAGGGMPAFSESVLPEAELRDIFTFVQGIPAPPAKLPALLQ